MLYMQRRELALIRRKNESKKSGPVTPKNAVVYGDCATAQLMSSTPNLLAKLSLNRPGPPDGPSDITGLLKTCLHRGRLA